MQKFVLLHDRNDDPVLIAIDRILYVEAECYGSQMGSAISVSPYDKHGEIMFHVRESVKVVYHSISISQYIR